MFIDLESEALLSEDIENEILNRDLAKDDSIFDL